jgi:hypothetical protein
LWIRRKAMSTRGFTLSLDELQYLQSKEQEATDQVKQVAALMEAGLQHILGKLGVDCSCEADEIQEQMLALGIIVQERDIPETPKANGFYVFQGKTALTLEPVAFISSPYIDNLGKANVSIELYRDDIMFEMGGIKLPVY